MSEDDLAADLLRGTKEIAAFLGFPERVTYHLAYTGKLPVFRLPGSTVIMARRSELRRVMTAFAPQASEQGGEG